MKKLENIDSVAISYSQRKILFMKKLENIDSIAFSYSQRASEKRQETGCKLNKKKIKISYRKIDEDWESTKN